MSHHSDDNMLIATSDSFWEPGNYKRTTKRIEDGHKLCDSLIALVQERAEIEKTYAKALKGWSKNWNEKIEKGPEYGTTEAAWKGVLSESDRICDLHLRVKENLCNDIILQVKTWQKDTYHKVSGTRGDWEGEEEGERAVRTTRFSTGHSRFPSLECLFPWFHRANLPKLFSCYRIDSLPLAPLSLTPSPSPLSPVY
jgi:hypothetical protein